MKYKKKMDLEKTIISAIILGICFYGIGMMFAGNHYRTELSHYRDSLVIERNIAKEPKKIRMLDSLISVTDREITDMNKNAERAVKSWYYLFE
jgi:hypothetical protein